LKQSKVMQIRSDGRGEEIHLANSGR
jgi:hypothetical protein